MLLFPSTDRGFDFYAEQAQTDSSMVWLQEAQRRDTAQCVVE